MADPFISNQRDPSQLYSQTGTTVIDFGPFPGRSDASVAVTGQTGITANAVLEAWIVAAATVDHSIDDHVYDPDFQRLKHRQLEYEFSNRRQFFADPTGRGAYEHNN
jgi:hypothetical protein